MIIKIKKFLNVKNSGGTSDYSFCLSLSFTVTVEGRYLILLSPSINDGVFCIQYTNNILTF